jgi:hypothetical protein
MALPCLKCASADGTCGRLDRVAASAALVEAAADFIFGSAAGDPEPDDASVEMASLLLARRWLAEKMGEAP